ncbi:GNAT family N-acetyltransferase [Evansella sp. AB-rgal1]|uniref:GNAT family N-acetyltransferase n=1 Tax=Evansella sp. AB-rgal1 TaxID=3242696 RepID=UPI00359E87F8
MTMNIMSPTNIRDIAFFLEEMNNKRSSHIGFCGEDRDEIYETLINDFSDLEISDSFVVAYKENSIVGALGLDIDTERNCADVWGPFVKENEDFPEIAEDLWRSILLKVPKEIDEFSFFLNKDNHLVEEFAVKHGGRNTGEDLVLSINKENFTNKNRKEPVNYETSFHNSFTRLHNQIFPNTYYDAKTIVSRLNRHNRLFLVTESNDEIKGYVYSEANPQHKEGNIEYIAVSEAYRKQGIGYLLLTSALDHLFSFQEIEQITICVSKENKGAIQLYRSVGFKVKYELVSFKVSIMKNETF